MSESKAKAVRRERRSAGIPDSGRTTGANFTDLDDTREQRRQKRFRKREYQAEMRATDPKQNRRIADFWLGVRAWLLMPSYRDGLLDPCKKGRK